MNLRSNQISGEELLAWNHLSPGVVVESWLAALISQFCHGLATAVWAQKKCRHTSAEPERVGGFPINFGCWNWVFSDLGCSINFGCSFTCFQVLSFQIKFGCSFVFVHHLVSITFGWTFLQKTLNVPGCFPGRMVVSLSFLVPLLRFQLWGL